MGAGKGKVRETVGLKWDGPRSALRVMSDRGDYFGQLGFKNNDDPEPKVLQTTFLLQDSLEITVAVVTATGSML